MAQGYRRLYGWTKSTPRHRKRGGETTKEWMRRDVTSLNRSERGPWKREAYLEAKHAARRVVWLAQDAKRKEW